MAAPSSATANTTAFSSTNAASDDDGIFDSLYWFTVPATTTGGTLTVNGRAGRRRPSTPASPGPGHSCRINRHGVGHHHAQLPGRAGPPPAQKKPPWVGAPLPATGLAAAPSAGSTSGSTTSQLARARFPIWPAVLALVVVAGVVVLVQRRRHRGALAGADDAGPPSEPSATRR